MSYRYYLRLRPPSIGTHPAGAVNQECWSPVRPVPPGLVKGYQTKAHGFVDYAEPLPLNEIFHWDLLPDPATMWPTWLVYHYWEDQDRDPDRARRFIEYDWTRGSRASVNPPYVTRHRTTFQVSDGSRWPDSAELLARREGGSISVWGRDVRE